MPKPLNPDTKRGPNGTDARGAPFLKRNKTNNGGVRGGAGPRDGRVADVKVQLYSRAPKALAIRDERVNRLVNALMSGFKWLMPADRPMVRSFCMLQILAEEAYALIRDEGLVGKDGKPHRLLVDFRHLVMAQTAVATRLGFSPVDRAQLQATSTAIALDRIDLRGVSRIMRVRGGEAGQAWAATVNQPIDPPGEIADANANDHD